MASPGQRSRGVIGQMDEHGNTSPGYNVLRAALEYERITESLPIRPSLPTANLTPERVDLSLTSGGIFRPGMESVFLRARSPVITGESSRVGIRAETSFPPSRAVNHFGLSVGENGERQSSQVGVDQTSETGNFLPDPAFDELLHRMNVAGNNLGDEERGENHDGIEDADAGHFRYLSSSQTQVSPATLPDRFRAGRESLSVVRNVTIRDSKRLKPRSRDDEYKRRVSISPSAIPFLAQPSPGGPNGQSQYLGLEQGNVGSVNPRNYPSPTTGVGKVGTSYEYKGGNEYVSTGGDWARIRKDYSPGRGWGNNNPGIPHSMPPFTSGTPSPGAGSFEITLIYEGNRIGHQVTQHMPVMQLVEEAGALFRLHPSAVVLLLFGMHPRTLPRENRLSDPPRVEHGATVLVFNVIPNAMQQGIYLPPSQGVEPVQNYPQFGSEPGVSSAGSKMLGNFKLPKFDGTSRYWKAWDKTFIRFLSIHQLDYVVEETFLDLLPLSPAKFAANKMVYYILDRGRNHARISCSQISAPGSQMEWQRGLCQTIPWV